jgi:hypothetical protein
MDRACREPLAHLYRVIGHSYLPYAGGGGLAVPSTVIHYPGLHPLGVGSDPFASGARPVQFWVVTGPPTSRRSVVT